MANINISYTIEDFMSYKDANYMLPRNIKTFCNEMGGCLLFRDGMVKTTGDIINSFMTGKNPNDIIFKNNIIEALNKITQKNYTTTLESLKKLAYIKSEHFITLTQEILLRAMTDPIAVKGVELPAGQLSMSNIYILIVIDFFQLLIKENNKEIKFATVFLDICRRYFDDFSDPLKLLDSNNAYRVDNYKGFTNFLGLMYVKNLLSYKVIVKCLEKIINLIYNDNWEQSAAENAYDGYKNIVKHCVDGLEKDNTNDNAKSFIKDLITLQQKIKTNNAKNSKLRRFTMMYHDELDKRINKLK
jgi:hypothetical protein